MAWSHNEDKVYLQVIPSFLAKTQLAASPPLAVVIPSLGSALGQGMNEDLLLCPVRALKIYMSRTREVRGSRKLLFISYKTGFNKDIRSATISFWIKKLIRTCYDIAKATPPGPLSVRAHDLRALSSSLAFLGRVPLQRVMESCTWKSHNTFTSFYLRDLAMKQQDLFSLGPLIAAQTVVKF